jgi:hypothetical protein
VAAFFGLALILSYSQERLLTLAESLGRFLPAPWRGRVRQVISTGLRSLEILRSPWIGLQLQGWSILIWSMSILVNYVVFLALDLPLSFSSAMFLLAVLQVGVAVPSAPGKLGVFHYLCALALSFFGIERGAALGYALLLYLVVFGPPVLLGISLLSWESIGQRDEGSASSPSGESQTGRIL